MNNTKIWSFSLALSFLFHSSVFAFFLINKKPNENFLDGINAQIGEFASVNFVANVPVGELKTISEESIEQVVEETPKEIIEEKILAQEDIQSPVEIKKEEIVEEKPKPIKKPKPVKKQAKIAKEKSEQKVQSTASAPVSSQNVGEFKTQVQGNEAKVLKASWQGLIKRHINKFKKYPQKARRMGKEGIVTISVSIDKNGNVLSASIKKSSEFADLDEAGLELFKKASPIPAPPSEIIGMNSQMTFNMPINYNLKDR